MCRLLAVRTEAPVAVGEHLEKFAESARRSKEYQGHGWGISLLSGAGFQTYRNIRPVWEDDLWNFGLSNHFLVHARSAFRDEGIAVENNMPFTDGRYAFIFNGELHGVRIQAEGRIGAEKIFTFIKRLDRGDCLAALRRGTAILAERSRRVRAMNIILSDGDRFCVSSRFDEDPEYFTLRMRRRAGELVLASEPYPGEDGTFESLPCGVAEAY